MKSIEQHLAQYAAFHRDRRNVATHLVGVPMIVFAVVLAAATVAIPLGPVAITLGAAASIAAGIYYLYLDLALGAALSLALFAMCAAASEMIARLGAGPALAWAAAIFAAGWALQFAGHALEGRRPAFFDDARQLLIGPVFVCAEVFFMLGARHELRERISQTGDRPPFASADREDPR